jgi:large subunit ribosomal protein L30
MAKKKTKELRVTLVRSTIGRQEVQKRTVQALGFRRLHQTRVIPDNPSMRGMIRKVSHLVTVEEVSK